MAADDDEPLDLDAVRADAVRIRAAMVALSHLLETPYTDMPDLTPWSRFVLPALNANERAFQALLADLAKTRRDLEWVTGARAAISAVVAQAHADNARLRERIHSVVDETQRRYAAYQARCDRLDAITAWARTVFEAGGMSWDRLCVAERAVITSIAEERDTWKAARDECERQFQAKVGEVAAEMDRADVAERERDAARALASAWGAGTWGVEHSHVLAVRGLTVPCEPMCGIAQGHHEVRDVWRSEPRPLPEVVREIGHPTHDDSDGESAAWPDVLRIGDGGAK